MLGTLCEEWARKNVDKRGEVDGGSDNYNLTASTVENDKKKLNYEYRSKWKSVCAEAAKIWKGSKTVHNV